MNQYPPALRRILILLLLCAGHSLAFAGDVPSAPGVGPVKFFPAKGALNLDLNYPGAGLRWFPAAGRALELIGQKQDDIFTGSLRYYYYPQKLAGLSIAPYLAAEGDYLDFKGKYSKGSGWGGGLFAGAEYRLGPKFSVQADLGALYVSVTDKDTSLLESGTEFLMTFGINFYFLPGQP